MVRTYDLLALQQEAGGHWSVMKAAVAEPKAATATN